jgi:hypothetical protein
MLKFCEGMVCDRWGGYTVMSLTKGKHYEVDEVHLCIG